MDRKDENNMSSPEGLIDWCLMPTLAEFQLYRGVKFFIF
jgi:hypothetical protein